MYTFVKIQSIYLLEKNLKQFRGLTKIVEVTNDPTKHKFKQIFSTHQLHV